MMTDEKYNILILKGQAYTLGKEIGTERMFNDVPGVKKIYIAKHEVSYLSYLMEKCKAITSCSREQKLKGVAKIMGSLFCLAGVMFLSYKAFAFVEYYLGLVFFQLKDLYSVAFITLLFFLIQLIKIHVAKTILLYFVLNVF